MSGLGSLPRLLRVQFLPVIVSPVLVGAAVAWHAASAFQPWYLLLVLLGSATLHLAANGIDDVYDYLNGTDKLAEEMLPKDAPGWKPIARGVVSVGRAYATSSALYALSVAIGLYLSFVVGWWAILIAAAGIALSYFYTAPPLKLDYRGGGLGELSIMLSFGPIPALGTYYVMTRSLSLLPVLLSLPTGILTTDVLISHDMIFYDVYERAGKRTLTVVLGRSAAARLFTYLGVVAYSIIVLAVVTRVAPLSSLLVLLALPVFLKLADLEGKVRAPPEYGARTMLAFAHSVLFSLLLALGLVL
ncbi:MAG TPA: prenyltransferase [Nitrososphaerales archaeon]|nr:prenyltransferase [Nitrososphaerales archaeon]